MDIRLKELNTRLEAQKMTLDVEDTVKRYLCTTGYSAEYGARPLNRMIQKEILKPMSYLILEDRIREGDKCKIRWDSDQGMVSETRCVSSWTDLLTHYFQIQVRPNWHASNLNEADGQGL